MGRKTAIHIPARGAADRALDCGTLLLLQLTELRVLDVDCGKACLHVLNILLRYRGLGQLIMVQPKLDDDDRMCLQAGRQP